MPPTCDYCQATSKDGVTKCENCGAPLNADGPPPDHRFCPFCKRRLLALGSPTCNYCGRALPESYVKAREATLKRIDRTRSHNDLDKLEEEDDALKQALKSLFDLKDSSRRS
jgi:predicted amidophosphoribosyltransferase